VDTQDYTNLITDQHADKPRFVGAVGALVAPFVDTFNQLAALSSKFDLDLAVGVQLDAVGLWVGISRFVGVPLEDVYFEWDNTNALLGWDSGSWQGPDDPSVGIVRLNDTDYRVLIKARIVANQWDGTIPSANIIWRQVFGAGTNIIIQDLQDMTVNVAISGQPLTAVFLALLVGGYLPLKPEGVLIRGYEVAPELGPLFAWDSFAEGTIEGWDAGQWTQTFLPT
jgi:Protein of unknown function (DUF2612)